tara:strand:+ start:565 stop:789 length:225 start_codon:yes stop_codon:yes gene_type:complete
MSKLNEMGKSRFVYEYIQKESRQAPAHSVGFQKSIDAAASEVAIRYSHLKLDRNEMTFNNGDVDAVSRHLRVKF